MAASSNVCESKSDRRQKQQHSSPSFTSQELSLKNLSLETIKTDVRAPHKLHKALFPEENFVDSIWQLFHALSGCYSESVLISMQQIIRPDHQAFNLNRNSNPKIKNPTPTLS